MKIALVGLCLILQSLSAVSAFTLVLPPRAVTVAPTTTSTLRMSDPAADDGDDEEGGLDLDLGEMFEMFDAADKEEDFDAAIKKVKKGD